MSAEPPTPRELWDKVPPDAQAAILALVQALERRIVTVEIEIPRRSVRRFDARRPSGFLRVARWRARLLPEGAMTVEAICERCNASRRYPAQLAGMAGQCERCRRWLRVPKPGTGADSGLEASADRPIGGPSDAPAVPA